MVKEKAELVKSLHEKVMRKLKVKTNISRRKQTKVGKT